MKMSRVGWAFWALAPVAALAYHYGPGQTAYVQDRAAKLQTTALTAEQAAMSAQDAAYQKHLAGIDARRAAFLSQDPGDETKAMQATKAEDEAYAAAASKWKEVADSLNHVQDTLGQTAPAEARKIRWARARATVRSGDIWGGINELETLVDEIDGDSHGDQALATSCREELATAYYYGARLLRLSGMPAQEWMIESGKARQHFRYLAENADTGAKADTENYQKNLELVLNLEQSTLVELQGKALPKDSPKSCCQNNRNSMCKKKGKKPPTNKDGRGAGGAEEITEGW
ncbi:MAG: hypothetical protein AB7G11_11720 [Phycisphaerales bacterium]